MKAVGMVLAMVLCATSAALHAESTGRIQFQGSIVMETCADAVAMTRSAGSPQAHRRCALGAVGAEGLDNASSYTERLAAASGDSGIDLLDYYADIVHARPGALAQVLTRAYD